MAENAARVAWFGAGVSLPRRLASPLGVRLAVRKVLRQVRYRHRAGQLECWAAANDGAEEAARAVERLLGVRAGAASAPAGGGLSVRDTN